VNNLIFLFTFVFFFFKNALLNWDGARNSYWQGVGAKKKLLVGTNRLNFYFLLYNLFYLFFLFFKIEGGPFYIQLNFFNFFFDMSTQEGKWRFKLVTSAL
jgi:hypothetical protein